MVDYQTISVIVASISVTFAATYYISTLRNTYRARQAAIFSSLQSKMDTKEFWEAYIKIVWVYRNMTFEEIMTASEGTIGEVMAVVSTFNHIGWLVRMGLLDIKAVTGLSFDIVSVYDVMIPHLIRYGEEGGRSQAASYPYFKYLYDEIKKRREKLGEQYYKA